MNKFTSLCMVLSSLILVGCWSPFASKKQELVIINVLDEAEFADCHIFGSINIPFDQFEEAAAKFDKNNQYVIYCSDYMCMSSGYCAKILKDAGFEHVWAYEGGMAEWYQKGYPSQGPAALEYLTAEHVLFDDHADEAGFVILADELLSKMQEFEKKS